MFRRWLVTWLVLVLTAATLYAAGGSESASGAEEPQEIALEVWYPAVEGDPNDKDAPWMNENIRLYEETHPNVTIERTVVSQGNDYRNRLNSEMAAGNAPDVFVTWFGARLEPFVENGLVMPLNDVIDSDPELSSTINPNNLQLATFDGNIYGLTDSLQLIGFFYNKSIFSDLNLDVPETYDELLEQIDVIREGGYEPIAMGNSNPWVGTIPYNYLLAYVNGYDFYREAVIERRADFSDPRFAEPMRAYMRLVDAGGFIENFNALNVGEARARFESGEAAMLPLGSWAMTGLEEALGEDLGFMALPPMGAGNGDSDAVILSADKGYSLGSHLEGARRRAAIEFLSLLFSEERQAAWAEEGVFIATRNISYDKSVVPRSIRTIQEQAAQAETVLYPLDVMFGPSVGQEFNKSVQSALGGADPAQVFSQLSRIADQEWRR